MRSPFLIGERIYLRGLDARDLEGSYLDWINDRQTTRFLDTGRFPSTRGELEDYVRRASDGSKDLFLAIVEKSSDRFIGTIKLGPIDWIHRHGAIGILIGPADARGKGYGKEAVSLVVRHAFECLGLNKVSAGAYADHQRSVDLFVSLGFTEEGRLRKHLFRDGGYQDKVLLARLNDGRTYD